MSFQVLGNSLEKNLHAEMSAEHTNDRATLQITDVIEDLLDIQRVFNRDLDRMRSSKGIKLEGCLNGLGLDALVRFG